MPRPERWIVLAMLVCILVVLLTFAWVFACTFTWIPPTTNTDGSPLTDLTSYNLYFQPQGASSGQVVSSIGAPATALVVPGACQVGVYWLTAVNATGGESDSSNQVLVKKPNRPQSLSGTK